MIDGSFWFFYFILIFFFILIIVIISLSYPYKTRTLVPGLTTLNYTARGLNAAADSAENINTTFKTLLILEGDSTTNNNSLEFTDNTTSSNFTKVGFQPRYLEGKKSSNGFIELLVDTSKMTSLFSTRSQKYYLVFRTLNTASGESETTTKSLDNYDIGWTSLPIVEQAVSNPSLFPVRVPFDLTGRVNNNYQVFVQVKLEAYPANPAIISSNLEINSVDLYYI